MCITGSCEAHCLTIRSVLLKIELSGDNKYMVIDAIRGQSGG